MLTLYAFSLLGEGYYSNASYLFENEECWHCSSHIFICYHPDYMSVFFPFPGVEGVDLDLLSLLSDALGFRTVLKLETFWVDQGRLWSGFARGQLKTSC